MRFSTRFEIQIYVKMMWVLDNGVVTDLLLVNKGF